MQETPRNRGFLRRFVESWNGFFDVSRAGITHRPARIFRHEMASTSSSALSISGAWT